MIQLLDKTYKLAIGIALKPILDLYVLESKENLKKLRDISDMYRTRFKVLILENCL